ncbi:Aste57867_19663 [Aphanomyces stellatus]|uniref:Aste57867_19663 protein n=1 Tax=Aphanomyces stellatus TaxID=120398 RepID=A0A485LDL8_9STRA|nr:hypothetical protein As57867_019598 [Aphanomyces stellatus]VFT96363.1 Aste57867_19663 [Aphanomyces stellatus]
MATFDRLNEIFAQPLMAEYHQLILKILQHHRAPWRKPQPQYCRLSLMSSESNVRKEFFVHYEKYSRCNGSNMSSSKTGKRVAPSVIAIELLLKSLYSDKVPHHSSTTLPILSTSNEAAAPHLDDILTWRSHMFAFVKSTFSWNGETSCWHACTIVTLAHSARKQSLPDVCIHALSQLYSIPAMDVRICGNKSAFRDVEGFPRWLNQTNLEYFTRQKAELYHMKGLFMDALGTSTKQTKRFPIACKCATAMASEIEFAAQTIAGYLQAVQYRTIGALFLENLELFSMDTDTRSLSSAPATRLASQTPKQPSLATSDLMYYRTRSGHVVAVPISIEQVAGILGLVGASRSNPSFFGSATVLTLDQWMEKMAAGELLKMEVSPVQ